VERISFEIGGFRRDYLLSRPVRTSSPLVVFLHGTGATAQWADEETGLSTLAGREGFILVLPEGLRPDPDAPPKFLTNPQRWNDGAQLTPAGLSAIDDVGFLAAVIDDVRGRARVDDRRVYVSGFSNGAAMTFRLATELAGRIAAIAPVAGYCWIDDPRPVRPIPTLYIIGSLDPLVPIRGGDVRSPWRHRYVRRPPLVDTLDRWARAISCEVPSRMESDTGPVRTDIYPGPVPFRVMTVDGLGHHWPGGKGGLNHRIAGPPLTSVDGSAIVWEFLRHHSL
jgi:polyhydroxybutyrate depolymerase